MATASIIKQYYGCWINNDREGARRCLADDLKFRSPSDNFDSADAFLGACWQYAAGFNELDLVHEACADSAAYIAYRMGEAAVGEFLVVRDGKIAEAYVTFGVTI